MSVQKYYPVQGINKFETVSFPMVKAFKIDLSGLAVGTTTTVQFPKGSIILGFVVRSTSTAASSGGGTATFGFTGKMVTSALAASSLADGAVNGTADGGGPIVLTADDTFDVAVATATFESGAVDVFVFYVPMPNEDLDSDSFQNF